MRFARELFAHYQQYHEHGPLMLRYAGILGAFGFPIFYLIRFTKESLPYDDFWIRLAATVLCVLLLLRDQWPHKLKPYYIAFSYPALIFSLPLFLVFTSLKNGGDSSAVGNTLMVVFFLILMTDWRNTVVMLVAGIGAAALLYFVTDPNPQVPKGYVARLPLVVLVVVGGSLFKFAGNRATAEKVRQAYASLAGSIAHEMRNPLSQIRYNLERMQQALPPPSNEGQPQAVATAQVDALYRHLAESELAVKRGLQVIAMTLDEVNEKPTDPNAFSYVSADEATHKAVHGYSYQSDAERSKVTVQVLEDFSFCGDETAYLFVLFNLIKNALYYLPLRDDGRVTVTIQHQQVRVRDNGPGIPPEALPRMFEPFRSVGKAGGTGLGLAYCQRVMRAFGGEIACQSVHGEYTQFTMRFPPLGPQEAEAHLLAAMRGAQATFRGKRLLVVDDDAALRMTTRHKLQPLDAAIDEAAGGHRALEMLARQRYDLVVLDVNMPAMDGYAVAERIRRGDVPLNRDICIVAHTSEPAHVASVKTRKAGMDGFASKPCAQLPLVKALRNALELSLARGGQREALLEGYCVLLADDNPYNREAMTAYLHQAGVEVVEASHGQAVLDLLQSRGHWDAVLLDINMPGMTGLEAAQAIRQSASGWRNVPIIALTAHSDPGIVAAAQAAGINAFLTKPVDASILYDKLRQVAVPGFGTAAAAPLASTPSSLPDSLATTAGLLDFKRLETYRRIGMLDELLVDYFPEAARLVGKLDRAARTEDLEEALEALHSLLGMSGEAGASGLYQLVRRIYLPMVEERRWPVGEGWVQQIRELAARTDLELTAYGREQSRASAT